MLFTLSIMLCGHLKATDNSAGTFINVGKDALYLELDALFEPEEVLTKLDEFESPKKDIYSFTLSDNVLWVYLDISKAEEGLNKLCLLEPRMGLMNLYSINEGKAERVLEAGMSLPFSNREYDVSAYVHEISEKDKGIYLMSLETMNRRSIPIFLGDDKGLIDYINKRALINGLYFGLLFIMIAYNSFVYLSVKDKNYLYYILFLVGMAFTMSYMTGLLQQYIFPDLTFLKLKGSTIYPPLVGVLAIAYISSILNMYNEARMLYYFLILAVVIYAFSAIVGLITNSRISYILIQAANLYGSIVVYICAIKAVLKGSITARYILVGWTFVILGLMMYIFTENGLLPFDHVISPHYVQIGSGIEILFFSFALADRINRYKEERIVAVSEKEQILRQSLLKDKEANRKLAAMELAVLRGQMNPHFIFNSLSAIRYYIQHNEPDTADSYLTKFAMLIRKYLDTSRESLFSLRKEVELLKLYTDLEMLRFGKKFSTIIEVDDQLDLDETYLPAMLVQPLVENAINHGLHERLDEEGILHIRFSQQSGGMTIEVIDNGIGVEAGKKNKVSDRKSMGTALINDRISTIRLSGAGEVSMEYAEYRPDDLEYPGTQVKLILKGFDDDHG
ncbi:MAG: histidine kinase [Flavobacteriales bacterium]|nr:histidine kinase [Flavobacteriales bacterium]